MERANEVYSFIMDVRFLFLKFLNVLNKMLDASGQVIHVMLHIIQDGLKLFLAFREFLPGAVKLRWQLTDSLLLIVLHEKGAKTQSSLYLCISTPSDLNN